MADAKKNPVTLQCECGACAMDAKPPVTVSVIAEVREGASPVDAGSTEVTLTSLNKKTKLAPDAKKVGPHGELLATFMAVPQGRYRALAVRTVVGKPEASAARNVLIVKIKGPGSAEPQRLLLTMTAQGVAKFLFVDDLDEKPIAGANVIIRHPDGSEQRHTTDGSGKLQLPGGAGEVFVAVRLEHPTNNSIAITGSREIS